MNGPGCGCTGGGGCTGGTGLGTTGCTGDDGNGAGTGGEGGGITSTVTESVPPASFKVKTYFPTCVRAKLLLGFK